MRQPKSEAPFGGLFIVTAIRRLSTAGQIANLERDVRRQETDTNQGNEQGQHHWRSPFWASLSSDRILPAVRFRMLPLQCKKYFADAPIVSSSGIGRNISKYQLARWPFFALRGCEGHPAKRVSAKQDERPDQSRQASAMSLSGANQTPGWDFM